MDCERLPALDLNSPAVDDLGRVDHPATALCAYLDRWRRERPSIRVIAESDRDYAEMREFTRANVVS